MKKLMIGLALFFGCSARPLPNLENGVTCSLPKGSYTYSCPGCTSSVITYDGTQLPFPIPPFGVQGWREVDNSTYWSSDACTYNFSLYSNSTNNTVAGTFQSVGEDWIEDWNGITVTEIKVQQ